MSTSRSARVRSGPASTRRSSSPRRDPGLRPTTRGNPTPMIGTLRSVVLDCREPKALADFYAGVFGGDITAEEDDWVVLTDPTGRRLAFQRAPEHRPPT